MIKHLEIENFEVLNGTYDFGKVTKLSGHNGAGKTGIGRAILWLYTGRDVTGSQATDYYVADKDAPMAVRARMHNGTEIERRQLKSGTKTIKVNGKTMSQKDFETALPVSWQLYSSIFMVGFFANLGPAEQREIFMSITPDIDKAEIFGELVGMHPSKVGIDFKTPTVKLWNEAKQQKKGMEEMVARYTGQLENTDVMVNRVSLNTAEPIRETSPLKAQINQLKKDLDKAYEDDRNRAHWEAASTAAKKFDEHYSTIVQSNEELELKKERLVCRKDELGEQIVPLQDEWTRLENRIRNASKQTVDSSKGFLLEQGPCKVCEKPLSKKYVDEINAKRGMKTPPKTDVKKLEKELEALKKKVQPIRDELNEVTHELHYLPKPQEVPEKVEVGEEPPLVAKETILALKDSIQANEDELRTIETANHEIQSSREQLKKLEADKVDLISKIASKKKNVELAEKIVEALHPVKGIDAKVLEKKMESVKDLAHPIEFVLRDFRKNGDPVDCFKIRVNGIPYEALSDGQKIKVNLRISWILDELVGRKVNVHFIDNVELVDRFELPEAEQVFYTHVNTESLKVEVMN